MPLSMKPSWSQEGGHWIPSCLVFEEAKKILIPRKFDCKFLLLTKELGKVREEIEFISQVILCLFHVLLFTRIIASLG